MKKLEGLKYETIIHPEMQIGCIKGCLDFLGVEVSLPWLAGTSGHAFAICVDKGMCPSGPSCIYGDFPENYLESFTALSKNFGCVTQYVLACSEDPEPFVFDKKKEAWEMVRKSIDSGNPCYRMGWEVICGYDDVGYYVGNEGTGPEPWQDGGYVLVYSVRRGQPADDGPAVKDALEFAVRYSRIDSKRGLAAYDNWIETIATANVDCGHGGLCDGRTWFDCRELAVGFLEEAKSRIGNIDTDSLFEEAKSQYQEVCRNLRDVAHTFRFEKISKHEAYLKDDSIRDGTVERLKAAKCAEADALKVLEKIVEML